MPIAKSSVSRSQLLLFSSSWLVASSICVPALPAVGATESQPTLQAAGTAISEPDSSRKYKYLAKTARERKEHEKALHYYSVLLHYQPSYTVAHYFRGKIFAEQKDYASAKGSLLDGVALDSLHVNTNALLCQLYLNDGKADSAQVHLNRIRDLNGDRFRGLQRRVADALRRQGLTRDALAQYENLAAADSSQTAELYDLLATLCDGVGDADEALNWRRRLLLHQEQTDSGAPGVKIGTLREMALLQEKTSAYDDALATLHRLAHLDSANAYPYYSRMADIAEKTNKLEISKAALQGMARANPRDIESTATLAEMFVNEGELTVAEDWIDRGLAIAPRDGHLQVLKGEIMARRGFEDQAIAAFEIARDDHAWRGVAQQRIWQLRPPETEEEKLKRAFFGDAASKAGSPE
jgi:tetratricopeptide (TPR) repeat protein